MKKLGILFIILASMISCKQKDPSLIWSDEFNYKGLPDNAKWGTESGLVVNNEMQYYSTPRIENTSVEKGNLVIKARKEKIEEGDYTTGTIHTKDRFFVNYGRIEARMKLPSEKGFMPTLALIGVNIPVVGWPECGEIDIMQHLNKSDYIKGRAFWSDGMPASAIDSIICDVTKYHTYAVEWDSDSIRWLLDGIRYNAISIKDNINSTEEFHRPFYIQFGLSMGDPLPGMPDPDTKFPAEMYVDWLRVYDITKK